MRVTHLLGEGDGVKRAPVVADGLVPEHALLPHLQQQPRVQVRHLADHKQFISEHIIYISKKILSNDKMRKSIDSKCRNISFAAAGSKGASPPPFFGNNINIY